MGILITTFGLIWLLLITAGVQFQKAKDDTALSILVQDTVASSIESVRRELVYRSTKEYRRVVPASKSREKKQYKTLNIAACIFTGESDKEEALLYILHRLLPQLYNGKTCLQEHEKDVYTKLLKLLFQEANNHHLNKQQIEQAKQLANVKLKAPDMQTLLYKILKGTILYSEKKAALKDDEYYSLLSFVSIENRETILCIHGASRELLVALFQDEKIVHDLLQERKILFHKDQKDDEAKRIALNEKFKAKFSSHLPKEVPAYLIDFELKSSSKEDEEEEEDAK